METKICSKCGKEIPEDSKFCPNCGAVNAQNSTTESNRNNPGYSNTYNAKKYKTPKWVVAVIVVVIVIALVGIIGSSGDSDSPAESSNVASSSNTKENGTTKESGKKATNKEEKSESKIKESKKPVKTPTPKEVKKAFISKCRTYNYKKLARYPKKYKGRKITLKVKVTQIVDGGWFDDSVYYRCYTNDKYDLWMGDEYVIVDNRGKGATKILQDDFLTVYGTYDGTKEMSRALTGTSDDIPCVSMKYCVIKE